jgi:1-piperideine-2-carboxylate/1-pyrroline-2-carboxylate reductase [NAD(P)H]
MLKKSAPGALAMCDAAQTAHRLPWAALAAEIAALLRDASVRVPARMVQPLAGGAACS